MNNLALAFTTIFPFLVYLAIGYAVRRTNLVDEAARYQMNRLIFRVFLPISLFLNVYQSEVELRSFGSVVLFAVLALIIVFGVSWFIYARTLADRQQISVMVQASFRSNFILFGLPLSVSLLPGQSAGITGLLIAVIVPLFNILAVVILQYYGDDHPSWGHVAKGIALNPFVQATLLAVLCKNLPFDFPGFVMTPMRALAAVATPLALIILGADFNFQSSAKYLKQLVAAVSVRLVLVPVAALAAAIALGFRGEVLVAFLALFASPVAVSSYTMAQAMHGDGELAGQILVYTTALCVVSLFGLIFLLKQFSFI